MFEKTIDNIFSRFETSFSTMRDEIEEKISDITKELKYQINDVSINFSDLSYEVKIAIYISLGLSLVDTLLLIAILKKIS